MKKILVTGLLFTFFFINGVALFASPEDLYGTWAGEFTEDGETIIMEFQFDESALIMGIKYMHDNEILEQEEFTVEISGWEEKVNANNNTKSDYPNGYLLELNSPLGDTFLELYISSDKRQIIIPELNEETGEITVIVKQ
jgi:hypothetical protein